MEALTGRSKIDCVLSELECNLIDVLLDACVRLVTCVLTLFHLIPENLNVAFDFKLKLLDCLSILVEVFVFSPKLLIEVLGCCQSFLHLDIHVHDSLNEFLIVLVDYFPEGLLFLINRGLDSVDIFVWLVYHFFIQSMVQPVEPRNLLNDVLDLVAQVVGDILACLSYASLAYLVVLHLLLQ